MIIARFALGKFILALAGYLALVGIMVWRPIASRYQSVPQQV
jgi:hypothetical protein